MSARTVVLALRFTRYTVNFALNTVQIQGNRRINSFHAHSGRMQFVEIVLLTIVIRYPRQIILKLFSYFCAAFGVHRREAFIFAIGISYF